MTFLFPFVFKEYPYFQKLFTCWKSSTQKIGAEYFYLGTLWQVQVSVCNVWWVEGKTIILSNYVSAKFKHLFQKRNISQWFVKANFSFPLGVYYLFARTPPWKSWTAFSFLIWVNFVVFFLGGASDEVKSAKASKENVSNKVGLKSAFSDSESGLASGAETSKRRTKSLDSQKTSSGEHLNQTQNQASHKGTIPTRRARF